MAKEPIYASVASIPGRRESLEAVVERLLPQVDRLHVYLNGYPRIPVFLRDPKIVVARSQDFEDRADAGKFFWSTSIAGYHLTCDDDFLYPKNYAKRLVAWIEHFGRQAVVAVHGHRAKRKVESYFGDRSEFRFDRALRVARRVHVVRTGLAAYHTDAIRVRPRDFPSPFLADLWFAALGQEQEVPFVVVPHRARWVGVLPGADDGISEAFAKADDRFTELSNDVAPWQLARLS